MSQQKKNEELSPAAHWVYMLAVLGGGFLLNVILIAILGGTGG